MIHPMTEARRQHVHGPLHRDRKYVDVRSVAKIIVLALLLWAIVGTVALVLS